MSISTEPLFNPPPAPEPSEKDAPDFSYKAWRDAPTPDNLGRVVKTLDSTIRYKLSAMGIGDNPQMVHQARLFAADAVRKYDPAAGVNLRTWTQSQLQSMQRYRRENQGPVKIPDRAAIDAWAIERAQRELQDETDQEPDVKQLADRSGLSVKRIAAVRSITRPMGSSAQSFDEGRKVSDFLGEALEYVYDGSDKIDRKIIELSTGYGGGDVLTKRDIAARLNLAPSQITRRSERIGLKLQEMERGIEQAYT